jgi:hypothetical protein
MKERNTADEMIEVINAHLRGEEIEYSHLHASYSSVDWMPDSNPTWDFKNNVYRVKPKLPQKPSINWEHVAGRFNWLANDDSGRSYLYREKPTFNDGVWVSDSEYVDVDGFSSFNPGQNLCCSQSLVYRYE